MFREDASVLVAAEVRAFTSPRNRSPKPSNEDPRVTKPDTQEAQNEAQGFVEPNKGPDTARAATYGFWVLPSRVAPLWILCRLKADDWRPRAAKHARRLGLDSCVSDAILRFDEGLWCQCV